MAALTSEACQDRRLKRELTFTTPIGPGKSKGARLIQELLRLHGINVVIDGDLGPATFAGLSEFCSTHGLKASKSVEQKLIDELSQPLLRAALRPQPGVDLGSTVAANAKRHLQERPFEIGGPNSGPWVRLYMDGYEGRDYPWCAGFVTYVVAQAAKAHGQPSPIKRTFSCDQLGLEAKKKAGKFKVRVSPNEAPVGSVFLVPHGANKNDWVHTGLIIEPVTPGPGEVFRTIEGNTNDEGSREGFEICQRYRACGKVDVILL